MSTNSGNQEKLPERIGRLSLAKTIEGGDVIRIGFLHDKIKGFTIRGNEVEFHARNHDFSLEDIGNDSHCGLKVTVPYRGRPAYMYSFGKFAEAFRPEFQWIKQWEEFRLSHDRRNYEGNIHQYGCHGAMRAVVELFFQEPVVDISLVKKIYQTLRGS